MKRTCDVIATIVPYNFITKKNTERVSTIALQHSNCSGSGGGEPHVLLLMHDFRVSSISSSSTCDSGIARHWPAWD
jgi:hypothetical protein